jgi:hypothetical protein
MSKHDGYSDAMDGYRLVPREFSCVTKSGRESCLIFLGSLSHTSPLVPYYSLVAAFNEVVVLLVLLALLLVVLTWVVYSLPASTMRPRPVSLQFPSSAQLFNLHRQRCHREPTQARPHDGEERDKNAPSRCWRVWQGRYNHPVPRIPLTTALQSTVLKQMKLIHHGGYSEVERDSYKEIIFSNTIQSMR